MEHNHESFSPTAHFSELAKFFFLRGKKIAVASKLRTNVYQIQAVLSVDTDPGGRGADKCSAGGVECEVTLNPIKARSARGYQTKERKRRHPLNSHRPHRACARRTRPPPPHTRQRPCPSHCTCSTPPPSPLHRSAKTHAFLSAAESGLAGLQLGLTLAHGSLGAGLILGSQQRQVLSMMPRALTS